MSYPPGHRLLHVSITFRSGRAKINELTALFNLATDWYHYGPGSWILWTNGTPDSWYPHVKGLLSDNDYLLIVEIGPNPVRGWLPQDAWTWLRKYKSA
jgi:hypothetical protein